MGLTLVEFERASLSCTGCLTESNELRAEIFKEKQPPSTVERKRFHIYEVEEKSERGMTIKL